MKDTSRHPVWLPPGSLPVFPSPRDFGPHGLVAGGGDLSVARLLAAYRQGIFPWYDEHPILWWSPDPRAVIDPEHLVVSRSLRRRMRSGSFVVTRNQATRAVLDGCARRREGTWLSEEMKEAYLALGARGHLHSYEVWQDSALVGGLYGVAVGRLFAGESMFHTATDASKVALVCAVTHAFASGVALFDVQLQTAHLERMGAFELGRDAYLDGVTQATRNTREANFGHPSASDDLMPWVLDRLPERHR